MPSNMPDARTVNEALRRAREMQNRSRTPAVVPSEPAPAAPQAEQKATPAAAAVQKASPLDVLLKDKERTWILALLILLSSEGNNTELLFALMYLLI